MASQLIHWQQVQFAGSPNELEIKLIQKKYWKISI